MWVAEAAVKTGQELVCEAGKYTLKCITKTLKKTETTKDIY